MDDQTVTDFLEAARQYLEAKKLLEQKMSALHDSLFTVPAARPPPTSRPGQPVGGTTIEDVLRRIADNVDCVAVLTGCICRALLFDSAAADRGPSTTVAAAEKVKRPRRRPRQPAASQPAVQLAASAHRGPVDNDNRSHAAPRQATIVRPWTTQNAVPLQPSEPSSCPDGARRRKLKSPVRIPSSPTWANKRPRPRLQTGEPRPPFV